MFADCCAIDALCDVCLQSIFMTLKGVAMCRADQWVNELAVRRRMPWIPWPVESAKVRELAIAKVSDITRDQRLRERLADELVQRAAKCWNEQRPID